MPMLLEDLADETSASIGRAADRLDEEVRVLDDLLHTQLELEELKRKSVEPARQATDYAISQLPQAEALWSSVIVALREVSENEAKRLLRSFLTVCESGQRLCKVPRKIWDFVDNQGSAAEQLDELDRTRRRFEDLASAARLALKHRENGWQPADADRLALGLQLAREGKTITSDQTRARFSRTNWIKGLQVVGYCDNRRDHTHECNVGQDADRPYHQPGVGSEQLARPGETGHQQPTR
jgi:hypothetical protein